MPSVYGIGKTLRTSNFTNRIATNAKPKQTHHHFLDGLIGILRWIGLGLEVIGTIAASLIPGAQALIPIITIVGSLFQSGLDVVSLANSQKRTSDVINFGVSTFINLFSLGAALKGTYGASKNILRVADDTAKDGVRYIVRGTEEFADAAKALMGGTKVSRSFKSIERVSIINEQKLIKKGVVPPFSSSKVISQFEAELQREFSAKFTRAQDGETIIARGGRDFYKAREGEYVLSNRDLSILRYGISRYANGKITKQELVRLFQKSGSSAAKDSLNMVKQGNKWLFKNKRVENIFIERIERVKSFYGKTVMPYNVALKTPSKVRLFFEDVLERVSESKSYKFFGGSKESGFGIGKYRITGHKITQYGQMTNPNDIAREVVNHGERWLLNGFKITKGPLKGFEVKGIRAYIGRLNKYVEKKLPALTKIINLGKKTRTFAIYKEVKKGIQEFGVATKDDTFLMGWRIINENKNWKEVVLYFNPQNTNAKTPGSYNYGGKKAIHTILPTTTLDILKNSSNPGSIYLLGGEGIQPIAKAPGGRRAADFSIANDLFMLMTLSMPIEPLRNILSLVSNVKTTIHNVAIGTYGARFLPTLKNTFERLWVSKVGKIAGSAIGGILGAEIGGHLSRIIKGTLQGFQYTTSSQRVVNGHKLTFKRTKFSFDHKDRQGRTFRANNLYKQAFGQNVLSASLKRLPKSSLTVPSTTRNQLKYKRYGSQVRRVGSVFKV